MQQGENHLWVHSSLHLINWASEIIVINNIWALIITVSVQNIGGVQACRFVF
jgi:hypothetical protein